ncbi:MAG TPA: tRNA pseudouridine(55) synthase TruB [Vicinamibacterales bacterium]|nr:tRNA pseudouridine(55) synthase TruB [Vicinamibacterales bacterium]
MNGAFLLDKPTGPTSHDAVARVRRALGERSIGHTGTLDPLASGLLVLLCGRATRLASLMSGAVKSYHAIIRLGVETDTYDAAGVPQADVFPGGGIAPVAVDDAAVDEVIEAIRQQRQQMPPPFSAKKVGGVRAYKLARKNEKPELKAVDVCMYALDWTRVEPDVLHVTLTCSAGYYVRAMAQEIGRRLGCGAHLEALRRTRVGGFDVEDAVALDVVDREGRAAAARMLPMQTLLPSLPAVTLTEAGETRARHGNVLGLTHVAKWEEAPGGAPNPAPGQPVRYRVLDEEGRLMAIAEATPAGLQPFIVLAAQE